MDNHNTYIIFYYCYSTSLTTSFFCTLWSSPCRDTLRANDSFHCKCFTLTALKVVPRELLGKAGGRLERFGIGSWICQASMSINVNHHSLGGSWRLHLSAWKKHVFGEPDVMGEERAARFQGQGISWNEAREPKSIETEAVMSHMRCSTRWSGNLSHVKTQKGRLQHRLEMTLMYP